MATCHGRYEAGDKSTIVFSATKPGQKGRDVSLEQDPKMRGGALVAVVASPDRQA